MENPVAQSFNPRLALWAGALSILTALVLVVIKGVAFAASGSVSVLASLVDSVIDVVVSVMNMAAIRVSISPADKEHRYGHGKVEGLAALMQGIFIAMSGLFLMVEAVERFSNPHVLGGLWTAAIVLVVSIIASMALIHAQRVILRSAPSLAVKADMAHYASDVFVNGGALLAILALHFGGPTWIDSAFAIVVALWLFKAAFEVGGNGIDMLLDRELPKDVREDMKTIIRADPRVLGVHDLRTRSVGMHIHISFDIEADPDLTLRQAHDIAKDVEKALLLRFPNAEIMIHIDPLGEPEDARHSVAGVHH